MRQAKTIRKVALLSVSAELTAISAELLIVRFTSVSVMTMSYLSLAIAAVWLLAQRRFA